MKQQQSQVAQSHTRAEVEDQDWPIAAGTLSFPGVNREGTSAKAEGLQEWQARFSEVARAGFDHVEVTDTWLRPGDFAAPELEDLAEAMRTAALKPAAVALIRSSVLDPESGAENLAYSHRSIDAAAALGAPVVSVGLHEPLTRAQQDAWWFWTREHAANDPLDSDAWNLAVTRLRDLGDHARSVGVLLSLEMYEDTFLGTAASAVRLVEDIGLSEVGLNPDTANLVRQHRGVEKPSDVLDQVLPYANYWHVKNYLRLEDPQRGLVLTSPTSMELGVIDYRDAFGAAMLSGFAGVITCEHYGGDGLSVSATNREYIRRLLRAGVQQTQGAGQAEGAPGVSS